MYNTHIKIIITELGCWITTAIVILALDVAINVYDQSIIVVTWCAHNSSCCFY